MSDNAPGWQPDPTGKHDHRYWDGTQWTEHVSNAGVASTDPYEAATAPADAVQEGPETAATEPDGPTTPDAPAEADAATAPDAPTEAVPTSGDAAPTDPTVVDAAAVDADTTAAWPTQPDAPAPPPPYVPVATDGEGGDDGGSKKRLLIGGGILVAIVIAVIAFMSLSGDDDSSDVRGQLAAKLQEEEGLSSQQADCVAGLIVDEAGEDAFSDTDFDADDPPPEFVAAVLSVGLSTLSEECGLDDDAFTSSSNDTGTTQSEPGDAEEGSYGSDPELDALYDDCAAGDVEACDDLYFQSPSGSEYEEFGDTCGGRNEPSGTCQSLYPDGVDASSSGSGSSSEVSGDVQDMIADVYESTFDLDRDKAECLAEQMGGLVESGEIAQNEALTEVFDYLSDCDISIGEISGN
jgi:hypothetical protein